MKPTIFFLQYLLNPRKVGAVFPSSGYLAEKMLAHVHFSSAKCIVEYGPGTGVFTDKIIRYRQADTMLVLVEENKEFYRLLKEKYRNEENLLIVNDGAEHIDQYVNKYSLPAIDYVISGLPFASLPKEVSHVILEKTNRLLGKDGKLITFQYTLFKRTLFKQFFKQITITREYRNVPPAYVFCCDNS